MALLELLLNALFGGTAFLAALMSPFALLPALATAGVVALVRRDKWLGQND